MLQNQCFLHRTLVSSLRSLTVVLSTFALWFASQASMSAQAGSPGAPQSPGMQGNGGASQTGAQSGMTMAPQEGDQSYRGSVPQGTATPNIIPLSMGEAINRGLKANLGLLTSEQSSKEVRAQRLRALSGLLPQVTGQLSAVEQQIDLQTVGFLFSFPGISIPRFLGPYNY